MDGNGGSPPQHVSIIRMKGSVRHFDAKAIGHKIICPIEQCGSCVGGCGGCLVGLWWGLAPTGAEKIGKYGLSKTALGRL